MRTITNTHTGKIISDTDLTLEYLYVGDYGKENNIKADFLGYNKRIEKVEHKPVDVKEKLVVTVSSQKGCPMHCNFCDCPKLGFKGNASLAELVAEITSGIALSGVKAVSYTHLLRKVQIIIDHECISKDWKTKVNQLTDFGYYMTRLKKEWIEGLLNF